MSDLSTIQVSSSYKCFNLDCSQTPSPSSPVPGNDRLASPSSTVSWLPVVTSSSLSWSHSLILSLSPSKSQEKIRAWHDPLNLRLDFKKFTQCLDFGQNLQFFLWWLPSYSIEVLIYVPLFVLEYMYIYTGTSGAYGPLVLAPTEGAWGLVFFVF